MTSTIERGMATAEVRRHPDPPRTPARRGPGLLRTSNGRKAVMAVTGAVLVLFLIGHMLGNLKIFLGAESFNSYAEWLRTVGEPAVPGRTLLTLTEIALVAAVVLHMWSAVSLARRAAKARPVKYAARRKSQAGGYVVHTMRYGGVIILLFVVWHLLDLTFGTVNPKGFHASPYDRVVAGFDPSRWWVTAFYILALVMVGLHLRHGLWSAFQTLGLTRGRARGLLSAVAAAGSAVLILGFVSVPIAVMIGAVK
ncbi:succinate dehydrogenase cytochrome b subunit [Sphaerisporangium siamense]|uniref:Succinate dehydrogenase / fumarate reductase cytochrome b subunit n=1 Tax=Sphaerisporangium siamense TaxID=795645 RepID=A0A7W7D5Y4_9ACTN|nr:succinate dehydrogenase cytochrome b subunit [Sphaerisporangium siamense]MBB4700905.1 succinate dehydrogenase / fumarate reductase cytochrome b subunit [Sphaerisporangium siamense]